MRLVCPNCNARYEIDATLIPSEGREVQCSNCGQTWFQMGAGVSGDARGPDPAEGAGQPVDLQPGAAMTGGEGFAAGGADGVNGGSAGGDGEPRAEGSAMDVPAVAQGPAEAGDGLTAPAALSSGAAMADEGSSQSGNAPLESRASAAALQGRHQETDRGNDADEEDLPAPVRPAPVRPPIDPSVLGILRAEAEREIAARRAERAALEQQGEFALAEGPRPRAVQVAPRTTSADRGTGSPGLARSALLPDLEAINSSLTATEDRDTAPSGLPREQVVRRQRSGFRLGFSLILLGALVLIALYLGAPALGRAVPALHPVLADYVDRANAMRLTLDRILGGALADLRALTGRG